MSGKKNHSLRNSPICLNCGQQVPDRFCTHCGQENIEPRQSFSHLFTHFFEDLTHYEGKFWSSLKYLLFKPGYLTREFLAGKRSSYIMPVRLYIFISFVTFLLPNFLPDFSSAKEQKTAMADSSFKGDDFYFMFDGLNFGIHVPHNYSSLEEFEKTEAAKPENEKLKGWDYIFEKKYAELSKYNPGELGEKFRKAFSSNIPKTLFLYMPVFALVLYLFSNKKKFWYFDQGIFTLHYFSFVLLVFNLHSLSSSFSSGMDVDSSSIVWVIVTFFLLLAYPFYFIIARKNAFQLFGFKNYFVSILVITINLIIFLAALSILLLISLYGIS